MQESRLREVVAMMDRQPPPEKPPANAPQREIPESSRFTRRELALMTACVSEGVRRLEALQGAPTNEAPITVDEISHLLAKMRQLSESIDRVGMLAVLVLPDSTKLRDFIFSQWTDAPASEGVADGK